VPSTPDGVAGLYADFVDGWLVHSGDLDAAQRLQAAHPGIAVRALPLLMSDPATTAHIARAALELAAAARQAP
jgi:LPPG:FO 2-phospho-L-lactate transferase